MRRFYQSYPKWQTLSAELSWSHYIELLSIDEPLEKLFYEKQCITERWSVRELSRQMSSALFHRLALSKDQKGVIELSRKGQLIEKHGDILKDPYVLEFLKIPKSHRYTEKELEQRLIDNLQMFLLELGKATHQDIGQMNLYLNYFKKEENALGDNEPIGIVLSAFKNEIDVEFALGGIINKLFVSKYQLYLPDKKELENKLKEVLEG